MLIALELSFGLGWIAWRRVIEAGLSLLRERYSRSLQRIPLQAELSVLRAERFLRRLRLETCRDAGDEQLFLAGRLHVTGSAARLPVSQPPLSRQIRGLEDEPGVALFEHGAKSVRLTEVGKVVLRDEMCLP